MSANELLSDLTLRIRADVAEFRTNIKDAGEKVRDFSKTTFERSKNVKKGFGEIQKAAKNMVGGVMDSMGGMLGPFTGLLDVIPQVWKGIATMTKGMNLFKIALAGTGIGLLLVALGSLVAYFTSTQRGADMLSKGMKILGAVFTTLKDTLSGFGEGIVNVFRHPMDALKKFGNAIKDYVVGKFKQAIQGAGSIAQALSHLFKGNWEEAWEAGKKGVKDLAMATTPLGWAIDGVSAAVSGIVEKYGEASDKAKEALQLERKSQQLAKDKVKFLEREAQIELQISELLLKLKDKEKHSAKDLMKYAKEAQALQSLLSSEKISMAEKELEIKRGLDSLGENMLSDDRETAELAVHVLKLKTEENTKMKELVERENEALNIAKSRQKVQDDIVKARQKELEELQKMLDEYNLQIGLEADEQLKKDIEKATSAALDSIDPNKTKEKLNMFSFDFDIPKEEIDEGAKSVTEKIRKGLERRKNSFLGVFDNLGELFKDPAADIIDQVEGIGKAFLAVGEAAGHIFQGIQGVFSANMDAKTTELDNYSKAEHEKIEATSKAEIEKIERSKLSEEEKEKAIEKSKERTANKVTALDDKLAKQRAEIAKKQAKMEKANNIFSAIMNGAQAVLKGLSLGGPIMAAISGGLAAAQIAKIASAPLPQFANGGTTGGGLSLVGERGAELVSLPAGTNVTRANKTEQLLKDRNNIHVTIESRVRGEDIVHIVKEVERRSGNNF